MKNHLPIRNSNIDHCAKILKLIEEVDPAVIQAI